MPEAPLRGSLEVHCAIPSRVRGGAALAKGSARSFETVSPSE
jgi:hypothetical protein